jgi:transketolase
MKKNTTDDSDRPSRNDDIVSDIQGIADGVRRRVLDHVIRSNGGYLSQALSSAEILATLYRAVMKLGPVTKPILPLPFPGVPSRSNREYFTGASFNGPPSPINDRFILSPAHYALALYALLVETERMTESGLADFNRDGSSVEMIGAEHSPGMEVTSGSLGQALSQAAGIALGRRRKGDTGKVWVFMSDGEFQIGQTWEAIEFLAHHRPGNIGIYVDVNGQQCDGRVDSVMTIDPLDKRIDAFGGSSRIVNGHDISALIDAGSLPDDGRPLVVLCITDPCRGIEIFRGNAPKFHYLRFKSGEEKERYEKVLETWKGRLNLPGGELNSKQE